MFLSNQFYPNKAAQPCLRLTIDKELPEIAKRN
jgi:hypothetical protein